MNEEIYLVWDYFHSELDSLFNDYRHPGGGPGTQETQQFRDVLTMCGVRGWNVYEYVRFAVASAAEDHRILRPKELSDADIRSRYSGCKAKNVHLQTADLEMDYNRAKNWLRALRAKSPSMYPSDVAVLQNGNLPLEAWFRVCYLADTPQKLYDNYGEMAWRQLRDSRRLLSMLRKLAPAQVQNLENEFGSFGLQ